MVKKVENLMIKFQSFPLKNIMKLISKPFDYYECIILIIFLYVFKILDKKNIIQLAAGEFLLILLKYIYRRKRPYVSNKKITNMADKYLDEYSFPSGHSFFSYLLSFILREKYPNIKILKLFPFLVAISRIYLGVHYPSDVIFGFIFATTYYKMFVN